MLIFLDLLFLCCCFSTKAFSWLPREAAEWAITKFEALEANRSNIHFRGHDRRSSAPFISGDGFRHHCPHQCEESNRCRMSPESVKDGECIFVKSDQFEHFAKEIIGRIPGKYIIVSHNGDLSTPDGQNDAPRIGMPKYVTSEILKMEYEKGRLLAHHGQNLWWKNYTFSPRPQYSHCLPIGLENRQYSFGKRLDIYVDALKRNVINRPNMTIAEEERKPLILVAFYPKSRVPDRQKVLTILGAIPPKGQSKPKNPFYNETDLNHEEWLDAIVEHRFVLCPFGHGLDTHRVSEVLLMGGIPVMRKSTISSCYDDSDNTFNGMTRGSLPIVLLDSWQDLTKERLEVEWQRITRIPKTSWDWKRIFLDHWLQRIGVI